MCSDLQLCGKIFHIDFSTLMYSFRCDQKWLFGRARRFVKRGQASTHTHRPRRRSREKGNGGSGGTHIPLKTQEVKCPKGMEVCLFVYMCVYMCS